MALGNPFLAIYSSDGNVRTYEYVNGVFAPIGVSAAYAHNPSSVATALDDLYPKLYWLGADDYVFLYFSPTTTTISIATVDRQGAQKYNSGSLQGVQAATAVYRDVDGVLSKQRVTTGSSLLVYEPDTDGGNGGNGVNLGNLPMAVVREFDISNSGNYITAVRSGAIPQFARRTSAAGDRAVTITALVNIAIDITPTMVRWLGDDKTIVALNTTQMVVYLFNSANNTFGRVHEPVKLTGTIVKAVSFMDGSMLAVSFLNGSTYTTRVYNLIGGMLAQFQDLPNFGQEIAASADGNLLVDVLLKRSFLYNGTTFDDNSTSMVNVASNARTGSLSAASLTPIAKPFTYLAALQAVAENTIDINNLKFTLLTNDGVFNEADPTIDVVTANGAREVKSGSWPAGGKALTNMSRSMAPNEYQFKSADDVIWLAFGTDIVWRYGVIYDATSGKPLIFFDYYGVRQIATNRELHFTFPDDVVFSVRK